MLLLLNGENGVEKCYDPMWRGVFGKVTGGLGIVLGTMGVIGGMIGFVWPFVFLATWYVAVGVKLSRLFGEGEQRRL